MLNSNSDSITSSSQLPISVNQLITFSHCAPENNYRLTQVCHNCGWNKMTNHPLFPAFCGQTASSDTRRAATKCTLVGVHVRGPSKFVKMILLVYFCIYLRRFIVDKHTYSRPNTQVCHLFLTESFKRRLLIS